MATKRRHTFKQNYLLEYFEVFNVVTLHQVRYEGPHRLKRKPDDQNQFRLMVSNTVEFVIPPKYV